ncbi:MAG TPA: LPS-assembly protein LptD [Ramlibacter sp.]|nr:LPS-assembly protein LptD [Ramlibacter sp.]
MHPTPAREYPRRPAFTPLALAVAALLHGGVALAQQEAPQPVLRQTPQLRETLPADARPEAPTFVEGDRITGRTEFETRIEGDAQLRRGAMVIRADRIDYEQLPDLARARGNVRINNAGNTVEGPYMELKVDAFEGYFLTPRYRLLRNGGYGEASRIDFIDDKRAIVRNATYTTCEREPGPSWSPAWILTADQLNIDNESEVGVATGAVLRFKGVPILPVPSLSFPLSDKRKSGLLPPTIALNNVSGLEVTQPYYWDIAPNRDATIYPTVLSKRGVDLGAEFRYLEPSYLGTLRGSYLPADKLRDRDRWSYSLQHAQTIRPTPSDSVGLSLNFNRVSDDNFWRDFSHSRVNASLTQRLLASDAQLNWATGYWSVYARSLTWQTLQDPTAIIVPPYDRLPQLTARHSRELLPGGLTTYFETDYTSFHSDRLLTLQPNAQRVYALAQVARPWQAPGWFFTPKLQLHATQYQFDDALATGQRSAQRVLPTFSLDGGLVFERETSILGRSVVQTLEPRAFYVYTPFRNQNYLPNYDSGINNFSFATIYTENGFVGNDRITDNNLLTLGVTSRLQDVTTGGELARFGIAQRLRFKDQLVTLPGGAPTLDRLSDVLLGASVNWTPQWTAESTVQYNPKTSRSERSTIGARYHPSPYRVVSAAYRLQRGESEQLDVGWQWPINDLWGDRGRDLGPGRGQGGRRWYSVGRLNMSLKDKRLVDTLLGVEYDGCCWIGRVALERTQAGATTANKRILFQLEFVGFTRLGTNVLGTLKQNIPRYEFLREPGPGPSRFTNYD